MYDERRVRERGRLVDHIDYFVRPHPSFYADLEHAIELAARGLGEAKVLVDRELRMVAEVIAEYELEEFVERKRNPEPEEEDEASWVDAPF